MDKFKKELKNAFKLLSIFVIGIPVFLAALYGFASLMANNSNAPDVNKGVISFICSKQEGAKNISYYLVNTVSAVDQTIQFSNPLRDVAVQMSRISNKGGWDTQSLCTPNVMDLPEAEWQTLSIGSDCGVGASISACDAETITTSNGVQIIRLFPLVNGLYSGTAGSIKKGALIKITGVSKN